VRDTSPIEKVFAELKHLLRKLARRTKAHVLRAIGEILNSYTPQQCSRAVLLEANDD
jgi:transposase